MKRIYLFSSAVLATLLFLPAATSALGLQVGPFSFFMTGGTNLNRNAFLDTPICAAIHNHQRVEIIVESVDRSNAKEFKSAIKRVVLEPYALGLTQEGKPFLKGNIVKESMLQETTVKYGDEAPQIPENYFSGEMQFANAKGDKIQITKIREIRVIYDDHFSTPDNLKDILNLPDVQILCRVDA